MNIARQWHCTVTDQRDTVWILGGCQPDVCWERGFIEQYSVSRGTYQQLTATPDIDRTHDRVNFCEFWDNFIYVSFYTYTSSGTHLSDSRIHVFDTVTTQWKVSSTTLNMEAIAVSSTIVT